MKKVLGKMSAFIFGLFGIAVLALLMTLTYGALTKLFPGNFANQMWGLVMFDIAAMCWAIAFVFQCKSTIQYAAAGLGFIVGFVGTLGMVAAEVMLSGQTLAQIETGEIGKWMVYGFIIVTALHAALIYAHHAGAPEIHEQINVGVARGEIVTEAISQATKTLEAEKSNLAVAITHDIVSQVKRDLGLYPVTGTPFEPKQYEQAVLSPRTGEPTAEETAARVASLPPIGYLGIAPYWLCRKCDNITMDTHSRTHCETCGAYRWYDQPRLQPSEIKPFQPFDAEDAGAQDVPFPSPGD